MCCNHELLAPAHHHASATSRTQFVTFRRRLELKQPHEARIMGDVAERVRGVSSATTMNRHNYVIATLFLKVAQDSQTITYLKLQAP